jgi:hypothetical protein
MPFDIALLLNILTGVFIILLIVLVASSILMTPKVVKFYVDSKVFVKSQQIKRIYEDDQNKFKLRLSDEQLLNHPDPNIAKLAKASDYTLKRICIELGIPNYKSINKLEKIVAILKMQGIKVKDANPVEEKKDDELFPEEPKEEADEIEEELDLPEVKEDDKKPDDGLTPKKATSIDDAKEKRAKELKKLSKKELTNIAMQLKIKYASKMEKAKVIQFIIDKEIEESVEAEGEAVKSFKTLKEGN